MDKFCISEDTNSLKKLDDYTKRLLIAVSEYCISNKIGDQKRAHKVVNEIGKWDYKILTKGTLLYRGTKELPTESNRATYYAPDIGTANEYIPTSKQGYLNVYKLKEDVMFLKLDSLNNANHLLSTLYTDTTVVYKTKTIDYTMYDLVRGIFTGFLGFYDDPEPLVLKKLLRYSVTKKDIIVANWLCAEGFNGYTAGKMKQKFASAFPAEVMICKPSNVMELVSNIQMRKTKSKKILEKIVNTYEDK